jgi:hypothetical protein
MVALPLAIAAIVGVATITTGPVVSQQQQQQVADVSYVTERVTTALDGVEGNVVHVTGVETDGKYGKPDHPATWQHWVLADDSAIRVLIEVDGKPVYGSTRTTYTQTDVDYQSRTWRKLVENDTGRKGSVGSGVLTAAKIKELLRVGKMQVVGEGDVIGSRPTIHLRGTTGDKLSGTIGLWIDRTTYLPVRSENQDDQNGEWKPGGDLTWLAPTPENLALVETVIPEDFTEWR